MLIIGEPDVASAWFPVNDHPADKASYTIKVTVPEGLEAVSNGRLQELTSPALSAFAASQQAAQIKARSHSLRR